jgi:hypothetical protein
VHVHVRVYMCMYSTLDHSLLGSLAVIYEDCFRVLYDLRK